MKYHRKNNTRLLSRVKQNNLKQILYGKDMKTKKYNIKKRVRMYDGTYQNMDTKYVITLTIEEAKKRGLIEE